MAERLRVREVRQLVRDAANAPTQFVRIDTYIEPLDGCSRPVRVRCADGYEYVIKGVLAEDTPIQRRLHERELFIEQVVGRVAALIQAPVPPVTLVGLQQELSDTPEMCFMRPGVCHGVRWVPDAEEVKWQPSERFSELDTNRDRWAQLAVLLGLFLSAITDRQYIRTINPPRTIYSVDHGAFASWLPIWNNDVSVRFAKPMPYIVKQLRQNTGDLYEPDELMLACLALEEVNDADIVNAIAMCPREWRIATSAKVALARHLLRRKAELLKWHENQTHEIELNEKFRQRGW